MSSLFPNEASRLKTLRSYCSTDDLPNGVFDTLVERISQVLDVPYVYVSIVHETEVIFLASYGFEAPDSIARAGSVCELTVQRGELHLRSRLTGAELEAGWGLEFPQAPACYAGMPLMTSDGYAIGVLGVLDVRERTFGEEASKILRLYARHVMARILLRRSSAELLRTASNTESVLRREVKSSFSPGNLVRVAEHWVERMSPSEAAESAWARDRDAILKVFDHLGLPVGVVDEFERFEYANPALVGLLGRHGEEIEHRSLRDFAYAEDKAVIEAQQARHGLGEKTNCECRVQQADGQIRHVLVSGTPRLIDGAFGGAFLAFSDITEQRRAEEALAKTAEGVCVPGGRAFFKELARHLAESCGASYVSIAELNAVEGGIATVLADHGDGEGCSEYAIQGTPAEYVLQHGTQVIADVQRLFPADPDLKERGVKSYLGVPLVDSGEEAVGILGVSFREEISKGMLSLSTLRIFATRAVAEIERRRAEARHFHSNKLESLGQLAGALAHDFNNVLAAVLGAADLSLVEFHDSDLVHEQLSSIEKVARDAAQLTRGLLAFSRRQSIQSEVVDLNEQLGALRSLLGPILGEGIQLEMRLEDELWPVEIDPCQFQQVVLNLASNARDAMPDGGTLTLATYSDARAERPEAVLVVGDTGEGMSEEAARRAFEPFYTTKPSGKGTGLGLSTCYGIIRQSGGTVSLDSAPGRGATFTLRFPKSDSVPTPVEEGPGETNIDMGGRVLLAEDNESVRGPLVGLLRRAGFEVSEASDGVEALEVFGKMPEPPDLLISDISMPQMTGIELAKAIRISHPGLKVLYLTGNVNEVETEPLTREAGTRLLVKPFRANEVAAAAQQMIAGAPDASRDTTPSAC